MADIPGLPPGAVLLSPGNVQTAPAAAPPAGLPPGAVLLSPGNVPQAAAPATAQPGFIDRFGQDFMNTFNKAGQNSVHIAQEDNQAGLPTAIDPRQLLNLSGAVGQSLVANPIVESAKSVGNYMPETRDAVDNAVAGVINSPTAQNILRPAGQAIDATSAAYQQFAKEHPGIANVINDIGETAGDMVNTSMIPDQALLAGTKVLGAAGDAALDAGKAINNALGDTIRPTQDELKATASANYQAVENSNAAFHPDLINGVLDNAASNLPQTAKAQAAFGQSPFGKLVDGLQVYRGTPLTLQEATELDQKLGDFIENEGSNEIGKLNNDGRQALQLQKDLRGQMANAAENGQVIGDAGGVQAMQDATKDWAAQRQMADIQRIVDNGNMMDNPATSIKNGFKNLARSGRMNMFAPDVQDAIRGVANGGAIQNFFRTGPGSRLLGMVGGAAGGGLPGAVVGFAASGAARDAAGAMQDTQIQKVMDAIAGHSSSPVMTVNQPINPISEWGAPDMPEPPEPAPPPPPQLALPAPTPDLRVAPGGQPAPASPADQAAAILQRQDYASKGLTPDILALQAKNPGQSLVAARVEEALKNGIAFGPAPTVPAAPAPTGTPLLPSYTAPRALPAPITDTVVNSAGVAQQATPEMQQAANQAREVRSQLGLSPDVPNSEVLRKLMSMTPRDAQAILQRMTK